MYVILWLAVEMDKVSQYYAIPKGLKSLSAQQTWVTKESVYSKCKNKNVFDNMQCFHRIGECKLSYEKLISCSIVWCVRCRKSFLHYKFPVYVWEEFIGEQTELSYIVVIQTLCFIDLVIYYHGLYIGKKGKKGVLVSYF